jgi:hypothetical protein
VWYVFDPECYLVREKDETVPRVKTVEGKGETAVKKVTHKKTGRRIKSYYGLTGHPADPEWKGLLMPSEHETAHPRTSSTIGRG